MPEASEDHPSVGLARRLAAMVYDALIVFALVFIAAFVVLQIFGEPLDNIGKAVLQVAAVLVAYGYFAGFWTHGGQTIGMRAWRIRVVGVDPIRVTWAKATVRFFAAVLSWLPAGLGFWWILIDPQRRAWHDRWSRTQLDRSDRGR